MSAATPPITGYRNLTQAELDLINEGKALAEQCGAYIAKLRRHKDAALERAESFIDTRADPPLDHRWISIGAKDLQRGFMAITRGIAQPTTF